MPELDERDKGGRFYPSPLVSVGLLLADVVDLSAHFYVDDVAERQRPKRYGRFLAVEEKRLDRIDLDRRAVGCLVTAVIVAGEACGALGVGQRKCIRLIPEAVPQLFEPLHSLFSAQMTEVDGRHASSIRGAFRYICEEEGTGALAPTSALAIRVSREPLPIVGRGFGPRCERRRERIDS